MNTDAEFTIDKANADPREETSGSWKEGLVENGLGAAGFRSEWFLD